MRRALVTGAAGFIGSHVAVRLLELGWDVWGIDNLLTGRRGNIDRRVRFVEGDVTEPPGEQMWADGLDLVVHCAASYSDPDEWRRDTMTNVVGCQQVAQVARHSGAQLVYFQTALPPVSSYAISKIAGQRYLELAGVRLTTLRLANVYGPRNLSGPIPTFYRRLAARLPCTVVDTARDMVFVSDLVDCVERVVDDGLTGTFDVCSGRETTILEQFRLVADEMQVTVLPQMVAPAADDVKTVVDARLGVPGWAPSVSLTDGVAAAVAWYRRYPPVQTHTHLKVGT